MTMMWWCIAHIACSACFFVPAALLLLTRVALPHVVSAAARAASDLLHEALTRQTKMVIPVQQDYFMPEDERKDENKGDEGLNEDDLISGSSDEEDELADDEGAVVVSGEDSDALSDDRSGDVAASEEEQEQDARHKPATKASIRKGAAPLAAAASGVKGRQGASPAAKKRQAGKLKQGVQHGGGDSGNESDGYGEGGLSWEAVLAAVKVSGPVVVRAGL